MLTDLGPNEARSYNTGPTGLCQLSQLPEASSSSMFITRESLKPKLNRPVPVLSLMVKELVVVTLHEVVRVVKLRNATTQVVENYFKLRNS